jgi:HTH-type transcriptional regulator / antitoxin HigA
MTTRTGKRLAGKIRDDYLDLILEFPLRPLRSEREYKTAIAVLDRMAVRPEGSLSPGEQDYLETLTLLVEAYDEQHFKIQTAHLGPVEMLKYLMEQSGMKRADLGRLLGNKPLASLILNGQRGLSKTHIRILADHFKVEPSLFLTAE